MSFSKQLRWGVSIAAAVAGAAFLRGWGRGRPGGDSAQATETKGPSP